ncbi:hypothetical protein [Streptomyces termitum]|uniref:hypothetical protein n=1 Tax=Streptomyces termitum TaxID=67368 RepID=UPI0033A2778D
MEAQTLGGIHVGWTRPTARNLVVALVLGYLLYQEPSTPWWVDAGAVIFVLEAFRVTRTV